MKTELDVPEVISSLEASALEQLTAGHSLDDAANYLIDKFDVLPGNAFAIAERMQARGASKPTVTAEPVPANTSLSAHTPVAETEVIVLDGTDASAAYALRVDLRAPGIRFYTTPRQGTLNTVSSQNSSF